MKEDMMVQKFVILFLVMMVAFVGLVRAEDAKEVVVSSAKELKGIKAKKITWKKDGAKMVLVKPYVPTQYEEKATFDRVGNPITKKVKVSDASPSLWVDTTEVTVGQFKKFLKSTDHAFDGELWAEVYEYSPTDKHPMIYVSQCKPKKAENSNGGMKSEIL
jgi:formylglycine-generating enzyme required for sulfatase activity